MKPTRKMLVSAGIVGTVLIGGASVAATASAERLRQEARVTEPTPGPTPRPIPVPAPGDDRDVVSHHVSVDPQDAIGYWTPERIEGAQPMPIPEATGPGLVEPDSD